MRLLGELALTHELARPEDFLSKRLLSLQRTHPLAVYIYFPSLEPLTASRGSSQSENFSLG